MEVYIQAASQVKEDITNAYWRMFPDHEKAHQPRVTGDARKVLDLVEIVFRNSAKNRLFTERIRQLPKSRLEEEQLVYAYLTTDHDDSYHDSMSAIALCKKVCYLMFATRYNNFGISERNRFQDLLRKQERICPEKNIEIYNNKKSLVELMSTGPATYATVEPLVTSYLNALNDLLKGELVIYRIESELNKMLIAFLRDTINPETNNANKLSEPTTLNGILTVFTALKKRGIPIPEWQQTLHSELLEQVIQHLIDYQALLITEIENLRLVCQFTGLLTQYIEPAIESHTANKQIDQSPESNEDHKKYFSSIKDSLSQTFQEWLGRQ